MGGKNHKPTDRHLIDASAILSRAVDRATVHLHKANIYIEDALLAELDGQSPQSVQFVDESIEHLDLFEEEVTEVVRAWDALLEKADRIGYRGNPLARKISDLELAAAFDGTLLQPTVFPPVWDELAERFQRDNLLATFRWERDKFAELAVPIGELREVLRACTAAASKGLLVDAVEDNRIPLRQYFAPLFSTWYYLCTMFLYSAMICTELFYRANGLGSLAERPPSTNIGRTIA